MISKFKEGVHYNTTVVGMFTEDFIMEHFIYDGTRNMFFATKNFTIEFTAKLIEDESTD